jgi:hypothetical protein
MAIEEKNRLTTIAISKKNRETLIELGRKDQTFDQILSQVLHRLCSNVQGARLQ